MVVLWHLSHLLLCSVVVFKAHQSTHQLSNKAILTVQ